METQIQKSWRGRNELPVLKRLDLKFDVQLLREDLKVFAAGKVWDGLGSDYASLCETHTRLPKMFFRPEELEGIDCVCDLDWEKSSYQQLSLTEFDPSYDLNRREEKSGSVWDTRVAKRSPKAEQRWFGKSKKDVPGYLAFVLNSVKGAHRARFAQLAPQNRVKPHIDYDTLYGIRIHIAIDTNEFCYNGGWDHEGQEVRHHIPADGSVWFVNPGVKHYAVNDGKTPRNHLIISVDSQELLDPVGRKEAFDHPTRHI
jgi:hypothetical protein